MDHELYDGRDGACAAADLTARLLAELALADHRLAIVEARCRAAAATGDRLPLALRHERTSCRRQVASLQAMLDGMPGSLEERHVASA